MSRLKRTGWDLSTLLCVMLVTLPFSSATQAQGVWSCTHGLDGEIEYEGNIVPAARTRAGWGLDFTQKSGEANWIHFAPPSIHLTKARYVALKFWTGSADAWVDQLHVYNLNAKVYEDNDVDLSNGWYIEVFDMGSLKDFSALGISVRVAAGVEMMSHRFVFAGACAYLEQPTP